MHAECFETMVLAFAADAMKHVLSNPGSSDNVLIQLQLHKPLRAASLFVACRGRLCVDLPLYQLDKTCPLNLS
jgi:hypothetical protein